MSTSLTGELTPEERKLMDQIIKELSIIRRTGKMKIGFRNVVRTLQREGAKVVIISSDIPEEKGLLIKYYCKLLNIPYIVWPGDVKSLGEAIGRPHIVSTIAITDVGTSNILKLVS